jgi:hypothetical protein
VFADVHVGWCTTGVDMHVLYCLARSSPNLHQGFGYDTRADSYCQLPFSGAASSAVVAAFSWIIERKYAMFNLSTVSSGWWYQG